LNGHAWIVQGLEKQKGIKHIVLRDTSPTFSNKNQNPQLIKNFPLKILCEAKDLSDIIYNSELIPIPITNGSEKNRIKYSYKNFNSFESQPNASQLKH
jgi:hypothetical protein